MATMMTLYAPGNQIEFPDQAYVALTVPHDLRFSLHRADATLKALHLGGFDVKLRGQLSGIHRHARALKHFEDHLATGDRILILGLLARMMRIDPARIRGCGARGFCIGGFLVLIGQNVFQYGGNCSSRWTVAAEFAMIRPHFTRSTGVQGGFRDHRPDGGIGRRTRFRSWRRQRCGGSSPLSGTKQEKPASAGFF